MNEAINKLKEAVEVSVKKNLASMLEQKANTVMKENKILANSKKIEIDSIKKRTTEVMKEKIALKKENFVLRNKAMLFEHLMNSEYSENQKSIIYENLKGKFNEKNFEQLMSGSAEQVSEPVQLKGRRQPVEKVKHAFNEGSDMTSLFNSVNDLMMLEQL